MSTRIAALALLLIAAASPLLAQSAETFSARLGWVPIGGAERNEVAGEGNVTATLSGSTLAIMGSFEGLPGNATAAKLCEGVATGARGLMNTPPLAELRVSGTTTGKFEGKVELTAQQLEALKSGRLYVQVYSERGVLPDHATLWGWLASEGSRR